MVCKHIPLQTLALPDCEIGVLNGKIRQWRGPVTREGLVEDTQFWKEHLIQGDTIKDALVQGQEQPVLRVAQSHQ